MPTVYVPHNVRRLDRSAGKLMQALDLSKAKVFGQLKEVVSEFDDLLFMDKVVAQVKSVLADFTEDDYLLAIGDPTVIALCAGEVFRKNGTVKMLKWDRRLRTYLELELKL